MTRRTGIIIAVVGIVALVAAIFLFSTIQRQSVSPLPQIIPPPPRTEPVVIVPHDVPIRALLRAQDLTLVEVSIEQPVLPG